MKNHLLVLLIFYIDLATYGQTSQEALNGKVSYITTQNVYVKFENTNGIQIGDTLFIAQDINLIPVLIVNNLSSISCVGTPIANTKLTLSTPIIGKKRVLNKTPQNDTQYSKSRITSGDQNNNTTNSEQKNKTRERFNGRLSIASYTNISNSYASNERLRYSLTLNDEHINNSDFSFESTISFTHLLSFPSKTADWTGLNNALKIYGLDLKYDLSKTSSITFGRKIYTNLSDIGAVDGFEYEKTCNNFTYGAVLGSRPDYFDYSFNPKLEQFGAFLSHSIHNDNGSMLTSLAVFDQLDNFKTDRRFAYFQHTNSLLKNVDFFSSFETDLYGLVNNQLTNTFDLTSTYISLRYRPWNNFSTSLSYDALKNIYYYQTFPQNKIDSTLDKETRQGLRFNFMYRPYIYFVWGGNAGYNLKSINTGSSMNANCFLSYTQLPFNTTGILTVTGLKTPYLSSMMVYGLSLNRDFLSGMMNAQIEYRLGNFQYTNTILPTRQNIGQMSLFWRIAKKLTIAANFEGTLETNNGTKNNYASIYFNISQRF